MYTIILAIHVLICLVLTVVVLVQQGKGADIGAVFGGSSQTVFGASGAGNVLTRVTGVLAVCFFCTSMYLAYNSTRRVTSSVFSGSTTSAPTVPVTPPARK
jgi:preprotein translocase subunit SecG